MILKNRVLFFVIIIFLVLILFFPFNGEERYPSKHEILISADQFSYDPAIVRVNYGDTVIFKLQSSDVTHGFYLDGYEIEQDFSPGITETIEFIADKDGKFRFRCSVVCGELHPFMIGELIVDPNNPFSINNKLSVLAVLASYLYIRLSKNYKNDRIILGN